MDTYTLREALDRRIAACQCEDKHCPQCEAAASLYYDVSLERIEMVGLDQFQVENDLFQRRN